MQELAATTVVLADDPFFYDQVPVHSYSGARADDIKLDDADWNALLNASKEQGERFSVVTAVDRPPIVS